MPKHDLIQEIKEAVKSTLNIHPNQPTTNAEPAKACRTNYEAAAGRAAGPQDASTG